MPSRLAPRLPRISFVSTNFSDLDAWLARVMERRVKIAFGEYVLDPDRRELTRGSEAIAVGPQVFDLLAYLVRNRDARCQQG